MGGTGNYFLNNFLQAKPVSLAEHLIYLNKTHYSKNKNISSKKKIYL